MSEELKKALEAGIREALPGNVWGVVWKGDEVTISHPASLELDACELTYYAQVSTGRVPRLVAPRRGRFVLTF